MTSPLQNHLRKAVADDLVYEREYDGFFVYCYTQRCQMDRVWNNVTRQARGLILDGKGVIQARPFDKFFNLFERFETEPKNLPKISRTIWEKVDGSMGTVFWDVRISAWNIATKGSFESPQAIYARENILPKYAKALQKWMDIGYTVITEIIYPENRLLTPLVIDYGEVEELRLLAVRRNSTGEYEDSRRLPIVANQLGMRHPTRTMWDGELADLPMSENMEGYVIVYDNGFRVKVKNPWYTRLQKALNSRSLKKVLELVEGGEWRAFWESLPKELQREFDDIYAEIRTAMWQVEHAIEDSWKLCSDAKMVMRGRAGKTGRRDFAEFILKNVDKDYHSALFSLLDGYDYRHHVINIVKTRLL